MLLGIAPMNQLDASAVPMDIFQETPRFNAVQGCLADDCRGQLDSRASRKTKRGRVDEKIEPAELCACGHGGPESLECGIWFACTGKWIKRSATAQLPAYQAMRLGIAKMDDDENVSKKDDDDLTGYFCAVWPRRCRTCGRTLRTSDKYPLICR